MKYKQKYDKSQNYIRITKAKLIYRYNFYLSFMISLLDNIHLTRQISFE